MSKSCAVLFPVLVFLSLMGVGCGDGGTTGSIAGTPDALAAGAKTLMTCYNETLGKEIGVLFAIPTAAQISAACSSDDMNRMAQALSCWADSKPSLCELTAAWNVAPVGSKAEEVALTAIVDLKDKCRVTSGVSEKCLTLFP